METFKNMMKFICEKAVFPLCASIVMILATMIVYTTTGYENYFIINFVVVSGILAIAWCVLGIVCAIILRYMDDEECEIEEFEMEGE